MLSTVMRLQWVHVYMGLIEKHNQQLGVYCAMALILNTLLEFMFGINEKILQKPVHVPIPNN